MTAGPWTPEAEEKARLKAAQELAGPELYQAVATLLEGLEPSTPDKFPGHSMAFLKIVAIPRAKEVMAKIRGKS